MIEGLKGEFGHPVLDAVVRSIGSERDVRDVFEGFGAEIVEAEEELRYARADIKGIEERAVRVWFRVRFLCRDNIA